MNNFFKNIRIFFWVSCIVSMVLVSCKSKTAVVDASKNESRKNINKIIENYYNNKNQFSTLYIKASAKYATENQNQNVTAEIKLKKDEQILISIRFLGITMAKASITPDKVSYYEKLNGTYYEGDFSGLSRFLGTDLDFNKVQNMILGRAIDNLKEGKYADSLADQVYRLDEIADANTKKSFYIDANNYTMNKQEITQTKEERMVQVIYSNKKEYSEMTLPLGITINSYQKKGKAEINMTYTTVNFNEELSFPYSVPNDYKRIIIK
ncbi:DUF4292 domain-containing protein [Flavobacterium nackdongense]|uniref:DUF4292 domain-containing protein n=1 Tax=Flavobacterium nackdongense TaxID=2547394 RepID=A0A4P6YFW3_9FLAO|nr:DUF4292 domain-containing protein [Flavobacterium nackdongense]QBN19333.1 DUF4292 domain-containing protein [Flavobacterium nackdongense]